MAPPAAAIRDTPLYVRTTAPVAFTDGFYDEERDGPDVFRWMGTVGRLRFEPAAEARFLEVWVLSEFHDLSQELTVASGDAQMSLALAAGWAPLSVPIPADAAHVDVAVNKAFPLAYHAADTRTLTVRLRPPRLHADAARHAHIVRQHENTLRNTREMLDGRAQLESTPVSLGIDLYGVCNVKPPCVYCEWEFSKEAEGAFVDVPFTVDTLREWGPFFDNSTNLVNCSIGEPFMMKNLDGLLDAFGDAGKTLEMTTNGQILTDRNIQKLVGRNIDLYISLDAGTPGTYAKLRNQRFDAILANLRRLVAAKGGRLGLPRVHLVFMPMRVNVGELEAFVRICADLQVDRLVLRPLNSSETSTLDWDRGGYHFDYQKELLPWDELVRVSGRASELCHRLGVPLADQMDFGGSMGAQFDALFEEGRRAVAADVPVIDPLDSPEPSAAPVPDDAPLADPDPAGHDTPVDPPSSALPSLGNEHKPLCTEPWKSLYVLRRGVFPCCYGLDPLTTMDGYRDAWNAPLLQEIRTDLAAGRLHNYCLRSVSCPIVRKSARTDDLTTGQALYMTRRRLWHRFNRATGGRADTLVQRIAARLNRVRHALKTPGRVGTPTAPAPAPRSRSIG